MSEQINPTHYTGTGAPECPGCSHESHFKEKVKMSEDALKLVNELNKALERGGSPNSLNLPDISGTYVSKAPPQSLNGRFIVESYKEDRALKATVQNGFAMVSQKISLKGLTILADVYSPVNGQKLASRGDKAYIREAYLQSQPWAKAAFTSDNIEGEFMIVESTYIEFVDN